MVLNEAGDKSTAMILFFLSLPFCALSCHFFILWWCLDMFRDTQAHISLITYHVIHVITSPNMPSSMFRAPSNSEQVQNKHNVDPKTCLGMARRKNKGQRLMDEEKKSHQYFWYYLAIHLRPFHVLKFETTTTCKVAPLKN
jgi:hypothetical protein